MVNQTRESSQLITGPLKHHDIKIYIKLFSVAQKFTCQTFNYPDAFSLDDIVERCAEMLEAYRDPVLHRQPTCRKRPAYEHRDLINYKRNMIKSIYEMGTCKTLSEVAELAKVSRKMARDVINQLKLNDRFVNYQYYGLHPQPQVQKLKKTIMSPLNTYLSVNDIKRLHPQFSKHFITREIKKCGKKWTNLKAKYKKKRSINMDPDKFRMIATHILAGLPGNEGESIYSFAMKSSCLSP